MKSRRFCQLLLASLMASGLVACAQFPLGGASEPTGSPGASPLPKQLSPNPERPREAEVMFHLMAGELAGKQDQLATALDHYAQAMRLSDDPRVAERTARIAVYAQKSEAALEAARRWVALAPEDLEARQVLAALYIRAGELKRSIKHLEKVLARHSEAPEQGFLSVTSMLSRERDSEAALRAMQLLVKKHQDNPYAHYAYAQLAIHRGNPETARDAVGEALKLRPEWSQARILQARVLVRLGATDRALDHLGDAVQRQPEDQQLRLTYARLLVDAERLEKAREQFTVLSEQAPEDPEILYALGLLNLEARRYEPAREHFQKLVEAGERVQEAFYYLGVVAQAREDFAKAIGWYSKVTQGDRLLDAHIRIAGLLAQRGDLAGARAKFQSLRTAHPDQRVRLYVAEAEMLRSHKRYESAMTLLGRALEEHPNNTDLLYARSLVAEKMDRLGSAEQDLRRILDQEPENAHALNALGYTLADRTDRYKEALGYIKRAFELRPNDPAIIDSLGWVHYRLGNHEEAVKYLRQALELSGDPEIAAHLGEVLWVSGNKSDARQVWERARREAPESEILQDVIERFTQ